MDLMLALLAGLTVASAVGAVLCRNLVHGALCLGTAFLSVAGLYLWLGAEFVGLAQILVNVGGVSVLIVFAILLTRGGERVESPGRAVGAWLGPIIAFLLLAVLAACILATRALPAASAVFAAAPVREMGEELMTRYVLPLEGLGLLLTAALIGAAVLAMRRKDGGE